MKRTTILGICITAFVAIAAWAPNVSAYYNAGGNDGCINCHSLGGTSATTHRNHTGTYGVGCMQCHEQQTGDNPIVANSCANCHDPVPLQTRHIENYGAPCADCHDIAPPAETNCSDGIDNNGNGLTDCADPDCDGFVIPGPATTCGQGACASTGNLECRSSGQFDTCQAGSPGSEGPFGAASCSDGVDNDCDGTTDAGDSDCAAPPEVCDDGIDNNGNSLIDCADPQCDGVVITDVTTCGVGSCQSTGSVICQNFVEFDTCDPLTPVSEGPFGAGSCSDGIDNDCDNAIDANDSGCVAPPEVCNDGIDNNGDSLADCADPQCDGVVITEVTTCGVGACGATGSVVCQNLSEVNTCQPGAPGNEGPYGDPSCSDSTDNNCNNQTDDADPNCQADPEICDNNIDDNNDGLVDCADPQCDNFVGQPGSCNTSLPGICSAGTLSCKLGETFCDQDTQAAAEGPSSSPTCNDTQDNDCDGSTDAGDSDCTITPPAPFCGDGIVNGEEECDIAVNNSEGCESDCTLTPPPTLPPALPPAPICGNDIVETGEQCDDGNIANGDGCSSNCQIESTTPSDDDEHDDELDDELDDEHDNRYKRSRRWSNIRSYDHD